MTRWRLATVAFLLVLGFLEPVPGEAQDLELHFIDVGQADAVLMRCPDGVHHMLVDAADTRYPGSRDAFRSYMERAFSGRPRRLDLVVASHPHTDHVGSMQWVLENFEVETYVDNGQKFDTKLFGDLEKLRRQKTAQGDLHYVNGKVDHFEDLSFCDDVKVEVIAPWAIHNLSDTNDRSVVVRIEHGSNSFLLVGDAEMPAEEVLLQDLDDTERERLHARVLKAGHHGSNTSSSPAFVNAVAPDEVVVSSGEKGVGTNTRYKHPRLSTFLTYRDWFRNHGGASLDGFVDVYDKKDEKWVRRKRAPEMWFTTKDGTVTFLSDGSTIAVEHEP